MKFNFSLGMFVFFAFSFYIKLYYKSIKTNNEKKKNLRCERNFCSQFFYFLLK